MRRRSVRLRWALIGVAAALAVAAPALAATIAGGEVYRLEAGQVVEDDLIVSGQEVYIDGTVKGDLIAFGNYVEVNGRVEGDLMGAAAELRLNGAVADDVRVAGAGVTIAGQVGDDLFAAAGGSQAGFAYGQVNGRSLRQGLTIEREADIGGSAYLGAGEAEVAGTIDENLAAGAGALVLSGAVGGDANLDVGALTLDRDARVGGQLSYSAPEEARVPPGLADDVRYEPTPPPETPQGPGLASRLVRLLLILAGFALLGWLALRFTPRLVSRPADAIEARPGQAALYGLVAALLLFIVPIISLVITAAIVLFWGWFPGLMFALLLTAALVLAWTLSPLITGLWLGQLVLRAAGRPAGTLVAMLVGAGLIVLLGSLPAVGWLVYLASFLLALGGVLLLRRGAADLPAPAPPPLSSPTPA